MYRKQSPNMITVHSSDNGPIVRNYTNDSSKFKLALLSKSSEDINEIPFIFIPPVRISNITSKPQTKVY